MENELNCNVVHYGGHNCRLVTADVVHYGGCNVVHYGGRNCRSHSENLGQYETPFTPAESSEAKFKSQNANRKRHNHVLQSEKVLKTGAAKSLLFSKCRATVAPYKGSLLSEPMDSEWYDLDSPGQSDLRSESGSALIYLEGRSPKHTRVMLWRPECLQP